VIVKDADPVHVTVTLAPVHRPEEGTGGSRDDKGRDIRECQINRDSADKISMVRNGREINYDNVARLLPGGVEKLDRYIGIEITFPAELDEFFRVRNVKRGAVPVDKLREELRRWLVRPVRAAQSDPRALGRGRGRKAGQEPRAPGRDRRRRPERANRTAGPGGPRLNPGAIRADPRRPATGPGRPRRPAEVGRGTPADRGQADDPGRRELAR
jgi:hypothetical protein